MIDKESRYLKNHVVFCVLLWLVLHEQGRDDCGTKRVGHYFAARWCGDQQPQHHGDPNLFFFSFFLPFLFLNFRGVRLKWGLCRPL